MAALARKGAQDAQRRQSQTTSRCGEMPRRRELKNYGVSDIGEHPMEIRNTNWRKHEKK